MNHTVSGPGKYKMQRVLANAVVCTCRAVFFFGFCFWTRSEWSGSIHPTWISSFKMMSIAVLFTASFGAPVTLWRVKINKICHYVALENSRRVEPPLCGGGRTVAYHWTTLVRRGVSSCPSTKVFYMNYHHCCGDCFVRSRIVWESADWVRESFYSNPS